VLGGGRTWLPPPFLSKQDQAIMRLHSFYMFRSLVVATGLLIAYTQIYGYLMGILISAVLFLGLFVSDILILYSLSKIFDSYLADILRQVEQRHGQKQG
jgi:hypothetical protein